MDTGHRPRGGNRDVVFLSYSRDDAEWMQAFRVMLEPVLERAGFRLWADTDLLPGDAWNDEIDRAIGRSAVALLLVSKNYVASRYIRQVELPAIVRRGVRRAPILVGSCLYARIPELADVQWLHDPGREGALDLVTDRLAERDRRIWQACERLLELLPLGTQDVGRMATTADIRHEVAELPAAGWEGPLSQVPEEPPCYLRRAEVDEIIAALTAGGTGAVGITGEPGLLGLAGQGGIGKSVLAAAVARDPGVRRRFPDGVYWVGTGAEVDISAAQSQLLTRLEPSALPPRSAGEVERKLRHVLADRRVLLVVDDVWSVAAAEAFRLTGPRGRIVYTSRDQHVLTAVGARVVPVDVLDRAAARQLAASVLAAPRQPGDGDALPDAADRALEQVGRVALAVVLLAAAVRGGRTWAEVAADLAVDVDVFGDHPYANTFSALRIAVAMLPQDRLDALFSLAVFPRDSRVPVSAVCRYWSHTRGAPPVRTRAELADFAAANLLTLVDEGASAEIELHDLQHDYLQLHAPSTVVLHGRLLDSYRVLLAKRDEWSTLPPDEPYIQGRLVSHLISAGARRELTRTVTDPAFVLRRIADGGVPAAERDVAAAAAALPREEAVAWWRAWLPRYADVLMPVDPGDPAGSRAGALAPTLRAWLEADGTRPASVAVRRAAELCPPVHLVVRWGLSPPSAAQIRVLTGHAGPAYAVAWRPTGSCLATAGDGGEVRLWDPITGEISGVLARRTGSVNAIAWSPDGDLLAAVGGAEDDVHLLVWDVAGAAVVVDATGSGGHAYALAWSPDGTTLATVGENGSDGEIRLWDPRSGRIEARYSLPDAPLYCVAWSPDGGRLAGAGFGGALALWETRRGRMLGTLGGHEDAVFALAWSPDGTCLASAGDDVEIRLWDPRAGRTIGILAGHADTVTALAWSPTGDRLASTSNDQRVRLWDPAEERCTATLSAHTGSAFAVSWSPDGSCIATAGNDQQIRLWDPEPSPSDVESSAAVCALDWCPRGRRIAAGGFGDLGQEVRVLDAATGGVVDVLDHPAGVEAVAWSPDGRCIATGGLDEVVYLWDAEGAGELGALVDEDAADPVLALAWSPDGTRLASAGSGRHIRIWDVRAEAIVAVLDGEQGFVRTVAWSPDGRLLATVGANLKVLLWDVAAQRLAVDLSTQQRWMTTAAWSPDGSTIAAATLESSIVLWDVAAHRIVRQVRHRNRVGALAWSPDGTSLAAVVGGCEIVVHDVGSGTVRARLRVGSASCLAWFGDRLAVAGTEGVAVLALADEGGG